MSKGILGILKKALPGLTLDLAQSIPQGMVIMILLTVFTVQEILFHGHEAQHWEGPFLRGVEGSLWYMKNLQVMVTIVLHCTHGQIGVIHQDCKAQPDSKMRLMKDGLTATLNLHLGLIVIDIAAGGECHCCNLCLSPDFMIA